MKIATSSVAYLLFLLVDFGQGFTSGLRRHEHENELVFTSILYRHGERTPEEPYKNDPYKNISYWPIGWGMLTDTGKNQHYELGKWLRKRYDSLIPNGRYHHDLLYVRSTDWDRTLMSALSNLAGMFYPTKPELWNTIQWQPIPVHTVPKKLDKILGMEASCAKYEREYKALETSPLLREYNKQHQELYKYITENVGEPTDDPIKIQHLTSTLHIQTLNNYTLPEWTKSVYPDKMYQVGAYGFRLATMTTILKRLNGGPLVKEIISNMKAKVSGTLNPNRNLWIYSAHDSTVAALLDTLGVFDTQMPPFASSVMVELKKNNDDYFVEVHYRNTTGEPFLLAIPGCSASCPLDKFESLLVDVIPEDWDKECQSSKIDTYFKSKANEEINTHQQKTEHLDMHNYLDETVIPKEESEIYMKK